MHKLCSAMVVSVVAATVGLAGQAGQQADQSKSGKVMLTGCIQNAPAAEAGRPAPTEKFVLADAKPAGDAAVGTAGAAGKMPDSYLLAGEEKSISPHVNHQVEITGMVESGSTSAGAGSTDRPTLKVEAVKMLATKCSS